MSTPDTTTDAGTTAESTRGAPATGPCPCGTGTPYPACCGRWIGTEARPDDAAALMRARYTAHVVGDMGFVVATHHPATRTEIDEEATARWARESEWQGLEIIDVEGGDAGDDVGRVEFKARYRDASRKRHVHHERARFERYHGAWYFRDAEVPEVDQVVRDVPKQGRNEPCACGSGKKHKRCCGASA